MKVLVAFDRDGTINYDPGYLGRDENWRSQIRLYDSAPIAIQRLNRLKIPVVVTSNQAGIARGFFDCKRAREVNKAIDDLLRNREAIIDRWYFCPFVDLDYAKEKKIPVDSVWVRETDDRKPGTGMITHACLDLNLPLDGTSIYHIGDKESDVQCGLNTGGKSLLVQTGEGNKDKEKVKKIMSNNLGRVHVADCLCTAVDWIVSDIRKSDGG